MSSSYLTQSQSGLLFLSQQHLTLQCRSTVCWRNRPGQKQPWLHGPSEPGNSDGADVCNTDKQNLVTQEFWKRSVGSHEFQGQKWNPKQMSPSPEWGCSWWIPGVGGFNTKPGHTAFFAGPPFTGSQTQAAHTGFQLGASVSSSNSAGRRPRIPLLQHSRQTSSDGSINITQPWAEGSKLILVTQNLI